MKSLNKTETPIFICNVFFVSKGNRLDFYIVYVMIRYPCDMCSKFLSSILVLGQLQ